MSNSITATKVKFEANYRIGADHRKRGLPIKLKSDFIADQMKFENDHSLILDLYLAYSNGYRAARPDASSPSALEDAVFDAM